MQYPRKWEKIDGNTERLEIHDGWLVRTRTMEGAVAICYVKDTDNDWMLENIDDKDAGI